MFTVTAVFPLPRVALGRRRRAADTRSWLGYPRTVGNEELTIHICSAERSEQFSINELPCSQLRGGAKQARRRSGPTKPERRLHKTTAEAPICHAISSRRSRVLARARS